MSLPSMEENQEKCGMFNLSNFASCALAIALFPNWAVAQKIWARITRRGRSRKGPKA